MTSFDPELLRRLADTDAASPPPPGVEFSPTRLSELAAHRARRQLLTLMAAVLLMALGFALWPRPTPANGDDDEVHAELRALRADLDRMRATLREWSTSTADNERAAADEAGQRTAVDHLRFELAHARAGAVLATALPLPAKGTNR